MTPERELQIIEASKENINAFGEIYDFYLPKIYAYCINRLPNRDIAEEITSKVFLEVIENLDKYKAQPGARFGSWLYRIAHNKVVDFIRANSKKDFIEILEHKTISEETAEKDAEIYEYQCIVADIMAKLSPRYQQILTLRYFSEMEISEIAEIMEEKPSNISVLIHRALGAFKKEFAKKYPNREIFTID